jgi:hypothetical protein
MGYTAVESLGSYGDIRDILLTGADDSCEGTLIVQGDSTYQNNRRANFETE